MAETEAVLFANAAFYHAFSTRDTEAMAGLWAESTPVSCIHPGWEALSDRGEVMESWVQILSGSGAPAITCHEPRLVLAGEFALVVCYEAIADNLLVATNIFIREDGQWRLMHHQAGPTAYQLSESEDDAPDVMH